MPFVVQPIRNVGGIGERSLESGRAGSFWPPHRRAIGYVFQTASLFAHMSVRRNLLYGIVVQSRSALRQKVRFEEVVSLLWH
jgi:molybdate transport system ATP-binding protein